jgi:GNAT superfamily N-acetyltransferase
MPYLPQIHSSEDVLSWIRETMPRHDEVGVAEDEARVVGFFALSGDLLFHLYVYPELHGQGAGSLLSERVTELSPDGFRLWVFQRNTQAREFYEHRGMRVVELTDGSENEEREPDALYERVPGRSAAGG